ncbi:TPA: hypothetical protein N0F65_012432 [Lagenidium giganteum]|uniref:F-box domain-containing protein n=1 Tax=Lagenidium giganteum TaxID=4803 RepID=A0AAV2YN03_9STRA|nr:TPA: hypothetical protein N0F65_012432 [Lagenidium giganteum]
MTAMDDADALRARNQQLEHELDVLRGVLALVKEDLNVKNDQIDYLYLSFLASKEHKRQEQEQRENALKERVDLLEVEIRAKEVSYQRVHRSLQNTQKMLQHKLDEAGEARIQELPGVLITLVVSFLDCTSIINAAAMHRSWRTAIMQGRVWKELYLVRWYRSDQRQGPKRIHAFSARYNPLLAQKPEELDTDDEYHDSNSWFGVYRERHVVERNWAGGKAQITTLNGHGGTVTCLQFNETRLVSGSDDGSMMLWSLCPRVEGDQSPELLASLAVPSQPLIQQHHRQKRTVEKLHSFHGHGGPVWALYFEDSTLVSGSYDKTVKVWDLQSGKCLRTLRAHTGWVSSLDMHKGIVASASWDSCICVWDSRTGALRRTLQDSPANPIYSLKWDRLMNTFITGCRRYGLQLWDAETGQKVAHYLGHDAKNQVNALKACDQRIVSGGSDHTVKVWDRRQVACCSTLLGHTGAVMSVDYNRDQHVISGSYDSTVKLWDLRRTASPVRSYEGHSSAVFSLQMDACKMISGSADTTIKIFRFAV